MTVNGRAAAVAAALFMSGAGCASARTLSEEDLVNQPRLVREIRPGAAGVVPQRQATADEGDAAADLAEAQLSDGDAASALETVRRALDRYPPKEQGDRLRGIRLRAKKEFLRSAIARGEASAPAMAAEGEPLEVRVALRNLSPVPLSSAEPSRGVSPTLVLLRVTRTAWDIYGNVRSESWEETHPLPAGEAGPGGALEVAVTVETERFREGLPHGFLRYSFGGSILPSGVRVGEMALHERIPIETASTLTFPQKGWEEVAAGPEAHLERGLAEGNPVRVLVAAACLAPGARGPAGAHLARILRDGPASSVENAIRAALRYLGEDPGADRWSVDAWEARAAAGVPAEEAR
jgi:hypothetical protein